MEGEKLVRESEVEERRSSPQCAGRPADQPGGEDASRDRRAPSSWGAMALRESRGNLPVLRYFRRPTSQMAYLHKAHVQWAGV